MQTSATVAAAQLDAAETAIGTSPILELRTGAAPTNCAAASTGTLIASMTLPSNWMADASGRTKALAGTWQDPSANAAGTIAHYRIFDSGGTTCHVQGPVSEAGGGGELIIDNADVEAGQTITIVAYTWTAGNA